MKVMAWSTCVVAGMVGIGGLGACSSSSNPGGVPDGSINAPAPDAAPDAPPDAAIDAPPDAAIDAPPAGPHHGYVVSMATIVAASGHTSAELGLDLGSPTSTTLDGKVDNQLGQALGALSALFDIQGTIDTAVDRGTLLTLIDLNAADLASATTATLAVELGANPSPAPCASAVDATCRRHLDGNGSFTIAADAPPHAPLDGQIVNGTFNSDAGTLTLPLVVASPIPLRLELTHARVRATTISPTGMTAILGGLVTKADVLTKIAPAFAAAVTAILDTDCPNRATAGPPDCGCAASSTGLQVVHIFDGDLGAGKPGDCQVTLDEFLGYPVVAALLQPDSCSAATCTTPDALSIGLKVEAVKATFPFPM